MARILLIEPNRTLAKQYWHALADAGHEVVICLNGHAAIMAADEQTPDIVVLELKLKKHNGVEFLYEFRSYPEWQGVPVIVQSLVSEDVLKGAAVLKHLRVRKFLYKPASSLKALVDAVQTVLPAKAKQTT